MGGHQPEFLQRAHLAGLVSADGLDADEVRGRLSRSVVLEIDGRRVGVVGATTPSLDQITSTGKIGILPADRVILTLWLP